ncbi:hypothetical protein N0B31_03260 [Salinirubellus salinus]|uniref:Right handed beta helix domain-containing protein n=1 Tax=Salinirubellus salinus TaxID=1364945 RepID=A0A9E7R3U3_9EURY|nr:hypothetical protein [Salinirubellus salinus]UWM55310.1 hypothetical protein N0B31_03260 [Salinirubellus salinus]
MLIGLGSIAAGAGTLAGTGAFTSVTATRDAVVNVAGDAGALLSIQAADSPNGDAYVSTNSNGEVGLDLSTDSGSGVNPNAVTQIDEVLRVMNQGTQPVGFYVEDTDGNGSNSDVVTFEANGDSVEGSGNAVVLEVGESLVLDIEVDTEGEPDLSDTQILSTVTFYADYAQSQTAPGQDGVLYVSKTADDADFRSIAAAANAVSTGETILVDDQTFEENVLVDVDRVAFRPASDSASPTLVGGIAFGPNTRGHTVTGFTFDITDPSTGVDEPSSLGGASAFRPNGAAINIGHASDVIVTANTVLGAGKSNTDGSTAISFDDTTSSFDLGVGATVANNEFVDLYSGSWAGGDQITFEGNTFRNCGAAIGGTEGGSVEVVRNIFDACGLEGVFGAVDAGGAAGSMTVSQNDFLSNCKNAVNNYSGDVLDARNNFYGDASGPDSDPVITDADSSVKANGDGVSIGDVAAGPINFAPFRNERVFPATVRVGSSSEADYASIGEALDNVLAGATILVEDGTYSYSTNVTVGVYGVTIKAASGASPTLDLTAGSTFELMEAVTVSGFTVEGTRSGQGFDGSSGNLAFSIQGDDVTVEDNSISGFYGGVQSLSNTVRATVKANTIDNTGFAIAVQGDSSYSNSNFSGDTIVGNTVTAAELQGIAATYTGETEIRNNDVEIDSTGLSDAQSFDNNRGIEISGADVVVTGNVVDSIQSRDADFFLAGDATNRVSDLKADNTIEDSTANIVDNR